MRHIVFMAAMVVGAAVLMARMADQAGRNGALAPATAAVVAPAQHVSVRVPRDIRGSFVVDGRVDGRYLQFIVDTGASTVALRARDAATLGIRPVARDFTVEVKTANGTTRAAPVRLGTVEVSGISVRDVTALVHSDEALSVNLLGNSFLSRLKRIEMSNGQIVLEQ
jgi:aspartyl protease family protein